MTAPFLEYELSSPETADPVILRITGQRERGFEKFKASNGVWIRSCRFPRYTNISNKILTLFARGNDGMVDEHSFPIPLSDWPAVKQAIRELNEYYEERDMKKDIITYDSNEYYWIDTWVYGDKTGRRELTVTRKKPRVNDRENTPVKVEWYCARPISNSLQGDVGRYNIVQFRVTGWDGERYTEFLGPIANTRVALTAVKDGASGLSPSWFKEGQGFLCIALDARDKFSAPVLLPESIYSRLDEICRELENKANEVEE